MNDTTNPVGNQIEALTGGSLADKVTAPKDVSAPVEPQEQQTPAESLADFASASPMAPKNPVEPQQPVISAPADTSSTPPALENVQDPVSYARLRFQKVPAYVLTMPNGDMYETDSLDKEKIMYNYLAQLRGYKKKMKEPKRTWQDQLRDNGLPLSGLELQASAANDADLDYFGYVEVPKGIKESFLGSMGRGAVNTFTSLPFDIINLAQIAALGVADGVGATETAKELQEGIESVEKGKLDATAHPGYYWEDVQSTGWQKWGNGVGSIAATVIPAFFTSGASLTVNAAGKVGTKMVAKQAMKRMGKEAIEKVGEKAAKETAEKAAKRVMSLRPYMRNPKFDPALAKESLAVTYSNKIANASNYLIAAGEAANGSVDVYLDSLSKTNDIGLSVGNALKAGSLVGVLGASPEWVHGTFGALVGESRKIWAAALRGDKAAIRKWIAGDVATSFLTEAGSEVGQDIVVNQYTNRPTDLADEAMTFILAGLMAGGMTTISNRNAPTAMVKGSEEWKQNMRAYVTTMVKRANAAMPEGAGRLLGQADIDRLMSIVDDPNFDTMAQTIIKKGLLENVDKMNDMPEEDKQAFKERLLDPNVDLSAETFAEFDRRLDGMISTRMPDLTPSQKAIAKSIMNGIARYAILARRIDSPLDMLRIKQDNPNKIYNLRSGGTESYTEGNRVNIATEGNINMKPYTAAKVDENLAETQSQAVSAKVNNQMQKSATIGMSQGAVDILHEILGHKFASDTISKDELPHFLIRYTELLEDAIKEVFPNVDISKATPQELDEYRAYAMANSSKIAEMLGFTGDTGKLFKFFEQMALADSANFGGIKEYVQTLRALLEENSQTIRGLIDNYGADLPAAIKHYADTGEAGMLTNEDLQALSRVFESGLADADAKIDLMSMVGDDMTYDSLTDRLNADFNKAIAEDKAATSDVQRKLDASIAEARKDIKNSVDTPISEEGVEVLAEENKKLQESKEEQKAEAAQEMVNNEKTFDPKTGKFYYLTKAPLVMPDPNAVKQVSHTKGEGEVGSGDTETYRASQLATTGLTRDELDGLANFAFKEIKSIYPDIFDELMRQVDSIVDDESKKVIPIKLKDAEGRVSGYMFKYMGDIPIGKSKIILNKNTIFTNTEGGGKTSALSSNVAYYVMAKRAAKADNKRYSASYMSEVLAQALAKMQPSANKSAIENVYSRISDYAEQYQAYTGDVKSDNMEYKQLLQDLSNELDDMKGSIRVNVARGGTTEAQQELLGEMAGWYEKLYHNIGRELAGETIYDADLKAERKGSVDGAKSRIKKNFNLDEDATKKLDSLKTPDEVMSFVHEHANNYKYLIDAPKRLSRNVSLKTLVKRELERVELAEAEDPYAPENWDDGSIELTRKQKKQQEAGEKIWMAQTPEEHAKAVEEYLKTRPEPITNKQLSSQDVFVGVPMGKIDDLFKKQGFKQLTPLTNYAAEISYAEEQAAKETATGAEDASIEIDSVQPEYYGFDSFERMQQTFEDFKVPQVVFDTDAYLNSPRTGKLKKSVFFTKSEFLKDYAKEAGKKVREIVGNKTVLSPQDKLTYVRAVIDAFTEAEKAYNKYTEVVAASKRIRSSKNGNLLLDPEGYEAYSSKESAATDFDITKMPLFEGMSPQIFDGYNTASLRMFPTYDPNYLELGTIVRFPYGKTPRTGMVALSFQIPNQKIEINGAKVPNRMYLIREAHTATRNGGAEKYTDYKEHFIPMSDFIEMFHEGKPVMVSEVSFDMESRDLFNDEFDKKLTTVGTHGYTMHSGGAIGSDTAWGDIAQSYGIPVNHYYAEGNKTPAGNVEVSQATLDAAKEHVLKANQTLKRNINNISKNVLGLLERNYEQVKNSDAVFAVGMMKSDTQVDGGTGWAVQMAIDEGKPVFVYDQNQAQWFKYDAKQKKFVTIDEAPKLTKNFAGVGTRKLNDSGRRAIIDVFDNTFGGPKLQNALTLFEDAEERYMQPKLGENPQKLLERAEQAKRWQSKRRHAVADAISPEMAEILKQITAEVDNEIDLTLPEDELLAAREYWTKRKMRDEFAYGTENYGEAFTAQDLRNRYEAEVFAQDLAKKTVSEFADSPFIGALNFVDFMDDLTGKANANRSTKWLHKIPLWMSSMTSPDRPMNILFGENALGMSTVEAGQRMIQQSEMATEKLQRSIVAALENYGKEHGKKASESFNEFFRNRLTNAPIQAELYNGRKASIRRGEIESLYAAKLIEETKSESDPTKYKYEQTAMDGGNHIYTRLKETMYKNADELIDLLTDEEKFVVKSMLDFLTDYSKAQNKRFVLTLGSFTKSTEKDWDLRQQYFTRATKAEMTDMDSLLLVGDLFDTMNNDFKADAIYKSGVKKYLSTMKNMLLFGLKYANAEEGLSGFERFLKDYNLRSEGEADKQKFQEMLRASNSLRDAVRQTLGKFGFERFMKRLDQDEMKPETGFKLLPTWAGKLLEQTTRTSMASALAFKPKNALLNFIGAWQRLAPLSNNSLRWHTTDLLDAMIHIKEVLEEAKNNEFISQRYSRNALGEEYQKVTDASSTESALAELSVWAKNKKAKGHVTLAEIAGKLDDFAKKMTKVSVGYGTSGADYLALAMGWWKLKPSLEARAAEETRVNAAALNGKGVVTAERLFMNHVLRTISSSNFMTRSSLQNWALRNHMGAMTAFLNDSLQSYGAIGEAWYMYHNAKTDAEKRYLRKMITSNIASQVFYIATQIGAFSALYGWVANDDGLTDAEQEYLWSAMWRELVGQVSSMTPADGFTRPVLEALFLKEKRGSGNIWTTSFQDLAAAIHDGDFGKIIATSGDLAGFAGTRRAIDVADAMWDAYSKDDLSYRIAGEVAFGRTSNTALKMQGLRRNSKGKVVEKKEK